MGRGRQEKRKPRIPWMKLHAWLRQRELLNDAHHVGDRFFVTESSVSNHAGDGVYALENVSKGSRLGFVYPGVHLCDSGMNALNEYLVFLTHQTYSYCPKFRSLTVESKRALAEQLHTLKSRWGIRIYANFSDEFDVERCKNVVTQTKAPCWDAIYDTFIQYRFPNVCYDAYYSEGGVRASTLAQRNLGLFINEPCAFEAFVNRLTLKKQSSVSNVYTRTRADGAVVFYASRDIQKGDELLLDYGAFYNREGYTVGGNVPGVFECERIKQDKAVARYVKKHKLAVQSKFCID